MQIREKRKQIFRGDRKTRLKEGKGIRKELIKEKRKEISKGGRNEGNHKTEEEGRKYEKRVGRKAILKAGREEGNNNKRESEGRKEGCQ